MAMRQLAQQASDALNPLIMQGLSMSTPAMASSRSPSVRTSLFTSGAAHLAGEAQNAIRALGEALKDFPNSIRVEGHTDQRAVERWRFRQQLGTLRRACPQAWCTCWWTAEWIHTGFRWSPTANTGRAAQHHNPDGRNANRRVVLTIEGSEPAAAGQPAAATSHRTGTSIDAQHQHQHLHQRQRHSDAAHKPCSALICVGHLARMLLDEKHAPACRRPRDGSMDIDTLLQTEPIRFLRRTRRSAGHLALLVFAVAFARLAARPQRGHAASRAGLDESRAEIRTLSGWPCSSPNRSRPCSPVSMTGQLLAAATAGAAQRGYDLALQMARNGATADDMISASGVTRHEAALLARLHNPSRH